MNVTATPMTRGTFLRLGTCAIGGMLLPSMSGAQEAMVQGDSLSGLIHEPEAATRVPFLMRGRRATQQIALTFDDGPCALTARLLPMLERYRAKATFFVIGNKVRGGASIARDTLAAGHEMANHSFTHPALGPMGQEAVRRELDQCQRTIEDVLQVSPAWFRPPYGSFRSPQAEIARETKVNVVLWSVDPEDWRRPGVSVVQNRVVEQTSGGSIILLHDIHPPTIEAVPGILASLTDRGFEFVTLSELVFG